MKKVHIIGIAGKATAGIAKLFIDLEWEVTGSDQNVYPPMSTYLDEIRVAYQTPYSAKNIPGDVDLVVVGGNALNVGVANPEVEQAKELGLPIKNYPEVLQEFLIKENSIVVAGNYGKGTITGAIVKALTDLGENPSYMVGGRLVDYEDNLHNTEGAWSVVEGDEYPVPSIAVGQPQSKIFFYKPKYLILTSAEWDHFDQFPSEQIYIDNFVALVKSVPADGLIVANHDGEHVDEIIKHATCKVVTYSLVNPHADFVGVHINLNPMIVGRFNLANLVAAYALLTTIGFDSPKLLESLNTYRGLQQRMMVVHEDEQTVLVRDYAHSPIKAKAAISGVKETWPNHNVIAILDIFASSLKNKAVLAKLTGALDGADLVLIPRVTLSANKDRASLVTGKEIMEMIKTTQPNVEYIPDADELVAKAVQLATPRVILMMSSGGLEDIETKISEAVKN